VLIQRVREAFGSVDLRARVASLYKFAAFCFDLTDGFI